MSLFQAREWWSTRLGVAEEFADGSMVVANIDNAPDGAAKIATGSLQGKLRVHHPRESEAERRTDDLLLEQTLDAPIVQLACGRAIPHNSRLNALIILQPRKLIVCTVDAGSGDGSGGGGGGGGGGSSTHHVLTMQYMHRLGVDGEHFTAFNMCVGPFGFAPGGKDLIAIQSMDGRLQIFDQDAESFSRRLPGCLLPGPLCYVPHLDSFVTCSSEMRVESYKCVRWRRSGVGVAEGRREAMLFDRSALRAPAPRRSVVGAAAATRHRKAATSAPPAALARRGDENS